MKIKKLNFGPTLKSAQIIAQKGLEKISLGTFRRLVRRALNPFTDGTPSTFISIQTIQ